tara:strand:- start:248 stop:568 length:321 start_codon:yes stop_codon:yes gene_type:complete
MISNYQIDEATKVVTVTYESKVYTLPPNNQDGVIFALPENDCEGRVLLQIEAEEGAIVYAAQEYARERKAEYNQLNQDEMRYDDIKNSTTTWVDAIDAIKAAHPKP